MESEEPIDEINTNEIFTSEEKILTAEEGRKLEEQNKRLVKPFCLQQLKVQARRHWDLFYKRNSTNFFKDRRWTKREFVELLNSNTCTGTQVKETQKLLEVGCGVGNLIFPLIEDEGKVKKFFYYACDFSPRAIEFVRSHPLYDESYLQAFECDITSNSLSTYVPPNSLDIITMVFVLSAIPPEKFGCVITNLWNQLKPGGLLLFRDYGLYDMAQLRFRPGHKISENFYTRQDGTFTYYFEKNELTQLFRSHGYEVLQLDYIHRRTINKKEGIDVPRIFLQGKFRKIPPSEIS